MQQTSALYRSTIDNIRLAGPKVAHRRLAPLDVWDTFDNRSGADSTNGWAALSPWVTYVWPGPATREWNRGIAAAAGLKGSQAAFLVVTNPASAGDLSVFGLYANFSNTWSLPANTNLWTNYVFSYSFREEAVRGCYLEMQVKSGANEWIEFKKGYAPGANGWDSVRASLADFRQPDGVGPFDPGRIVGIAVNIRMLQNNALYVGLIDDVWFDAPDIPVTTGDLLGVYHSANDSPAQNSPCAFDSIELTESGQVALSWAALTNRLYTVECQDFDLAYGLRFVPLRALTGLWRETPGVLRVVDTNQPTSSTRWYRLKSQPR